MSWKHLQLSLNGIQLHLVTEGSGPLVVLCHGFPGLWYSWRHQIPTLAAAGYQVVALDMRGYGRSDRPDPPEAYRYDCQAADLLAVMDHFASEQAIIVGHDFGANLAWYFALLHPERTRAVVSLSVPYAMELAGGGEQRPSELFARVAQEHFFHMHYFQEKGVAESEFSGRERELLEKLFWALSAEGHLLNWQHFSSEGTGYLDVLEPPARTLPWAWLTAADMDYYLSEYLSAGEDKAFAGGLNAYRAMDSNWALSRPFYQEKVEVPALFVIGEEDPVLALSGDEALNTMRCLVPDLRGCHVMPQAGHFVQQEQPERLNRVLVDFLAGL